MHFANTGLSRRHSADSFRQVTSLQLYPQCSFANDTHLCADGRFRGDETIQTVQCDQSVGTCNIQVLAPSFALVFLTSGALSEVEPSSTQTFATTTVTGHPFASVNPSVLATSNGHSGVDRGLVGSTSKGSSDALSSGIVPGLCSLMATVFSAMLLLGLSSRT